MDKLVFDLGAHQGEDTEFYLRKGFRVLAVEANPSLAQGLRRRFSQEIENGRLVLIDRALWTEDDRDIEFFVNQKNSVWGTAIRSWMEDFRLLGAESEAIRVRTVTVQTLLLEFGVPYYMKVDLEGFDQTLLRQLCEFAEQDGRFKECQYLSWESSQVDLADLVVEFELATRLGFRKFAVVAQHEIGGVQRCANEGEPIDFHFKYNSSGPFGKDLSAPFESRDHALRLYQEIFFRYRLLGDKGLLKECPHPPTRLALTDLFTRLLGQPGWYDTHAARLDSGPSAT